MLAYVHQFLLNWSFTLLVEIFFFILVTRYFFKISYQKISLSRLVIGGIFASSITIPWVWFVSPVLFYNSIPIAVMIGEMFAFVVESVFYVFAFKFSVRQAIVISLITNIASFSLGQVLLY